jgi:hypothetical protein
MRIKFRIYRINLFDYISLIYKTLKTLLGEFGFFKLKALTTVIDVTHDAYLENGLHLPKNGVG